MSGDFNQYDVVPHVRVGPVHFGMTRAEVCTAMGPHHRSFRKTPASRYDTDAFGSSFHVFYGGDDPTVQFIELSRGGGIRAVFDGADVFASDADELVRRVSRLAAFDPTDPELGYSYIFPALDLSLWRPTVPESDDDGGGRRFATIGVGVKGYYSQ